MVKGSCKTIAAGNQRWTFVFANCNRHQLARWRSRVLYYMFCQLIVQPCDCFGIALLISLPSIWMIIYFSLQYQVMQCITANDNKHAVSTYREQTQNWGSVNARFPALRTSYFELWFTELVTFASLPVACCDWPSNISWFQSKSR